MAVEPKDKFPTYAELAQTQAWAGGRQEPIAAPELELAAGDSGVRYTERAVLGVGGMGKITLAHDARIGRDVAVKQLRPDRALMPEERSRFLREAQVQGQLEHPSIVPVYDIDRRPDGTTFFTMRRVLGGRCTTSSMICAAACRRRWRATRGASCCRRSRRCASRWTTRTAAG